MRKTEEWPEYPQVAVKRGGEHYSQMERTTKELGLLCFICPVGFHMHGKVNDLKVVIRK